MASSIRVAYWRLGLDGFRIKHAIDMFKSYLVCRPFDRLELKGVGAEIGVFHGQHLKEMLARHSCITKIYAVDPYDPNYFWAMPGLDKAEATAKAITKRWVDKIQWVKGTSEDLKQPLDFAYIDGDHSYEGASTDIRNVWPLIKSGGIMGGHDFIPAYNDKVCKAVIEFAAEKNLPLNVTTPDWWIIKL